MSDLGDNSRTFARTDDDKRAAVRRILSNPTFGMFTDNMVAAICDADKHLVREIRAEMTTRAQLVQVPADTGPPETEPDVGEVEEQHAAQSADIEDTIRILCNLALPDDEAAATLARLTHLDAAKDLRGLLADRGRLLTRLREAAQTLRARTMAFEDAAGEADRQHRHEVATLTQRLHEMQEERNALRVALEAEKAEVARLRAERDKRPGPDDVDRIVLRAANEQLSYRVADLARVLNVKNEGRCDEWHRLLDCIRQREADAAALRAAIEQAPHAPGCLSERWGGPRAAENCTCWKARALAATPVPTAGQKTEGTDGE